MGRKKSGGLAYWDKAYEVHYFVCNNIVYARTKKEEWHKTDVLTVTIDRFKAYGWVVECNQTLVPNLVTLENLILGTSNGA